MSIKPTFNIKLMEGQEDHVNKIYAALKRFHGYIEASPTGYGKTYVTSYLANLLGLTMIVICPASSRKPWDDIKEKGGAWVSYLFTHGEIRGSTTYTSKFPYLKRIENITYDENGKKKVDVSYETTQYYDQLLDKGVFLVFDEVAALKNESSQITKAVAALINRLIERPTKSRYVLISALMVDSEEQAATFAEIMGLYHPPLVSYSMITKEYDPTGLLEAIRFFRWLSFDGTEQVLQQFPNIDSRTNKELAYSIIYRLMIDVLTPRLMFKMSPISIEADQAAYYYNMTDIEYERYKIAVKALEDSSLYDPATDTVRGIQIKDYESLMRDIEYSKLGIVVRETLKVLSTQATSKVIINVDSIGSVIMLEDAFNALGLRPAIIRGSVSQSDRADIINKFNEPNLDVRVIIATTKTAGASISIHDEHGGFPRTTFILQRFGIMQTYQAANRTIRRGARSKATVRLVFGKHYSQSADQLEVKERRIIDAMDRRSSVAEDFHSTEESNVLYPAHYPQVFADPDASIASFHMPELEQDGIATLSMQDIDDIKAGRSYYVAQPSIFLQ